MKHSESKLFLTSAALFFMSAVLGQELKEREWRSNWTEAQVHDVAFDASENTFLSITLAGWDTSVAIGMKVNPNLELDWAREIRVSGKSVYLKTVSTLSNGQILFGGTSILKPDSVIFDEDASLFKLDSEGNLLWERTYRQNYIEEVNFIFELSNGNLLLALQKRSSLQPTLFAVTDPDGNIQNHFSLNYTRTSDTLGIRFNSIRQVENVFYGVATIFDEGNDRVGMLIAFDLDEVFWSKAYDPAKIDISLESLEPMPDGGLLALGEFSDLQLNLAKDIWMLAVEEDGNPIWSKHLYRENLYNEFLFGTLESSNRGIVFLPGGDFLFTQSHQIGTQGYVYEPVISRFDVDGNLQWAKQIEGSSLTYVKILSDNLALMAGRGNGIYGGPTMSTSSFDGVTACGTSEESDIVLADLEIEASDIEVLFGSMEEIEQGTDSTIVLSSDLEVEDLCQNSLNISSANSEDVVKVYPIPATGNLFLELDDANSKDLMITLIDMLGKRHIVEVISNSYGLIELNLSSLTQGLYIVYIRNNTGLSARKKIVVKR